MDTADRKFPDLKVQRQGRRATLVCAVVCFGALLSGCYTAKLPPPPPKYVYQQEKGPQASANSLWNDSAGLFENVKARRLNDLVTINVVENISGTGTAGTTANKKSTLDVGVTGFFGSPLSFGLNNLWGGQTPFAPVAGGSASEAFTGTGNTSRVGKLVGTLTAKVVEVMPNGNFVLESRKDITINNEKQTLVLRGMVRPDDIATDNTILSSRVADAQVFYVGDGIVNQKQSPGWFVQILDAVWPF
jgi:flagellar L-ring protein precursor FlgH